MLLADDHRRVAEKLRSLLSPEFELLDVVEDGRALVAAANKLRPVVIVADITMPHLNWYFKFWSYCEAEFVEVCCFRRVAAVAAGPASGPRRYPVIFQKRT